MVSFVDYLPLFFTCFNKMTPLHVTLPSIQVIGSPPNSWTHLTAALAHVSVTLNPPTSANWIPANTWTDVIHPEVLRQCDELDGVSS